MKQSIYIVNPIMTYQDFPLPYLYLIFKSYHKEFGKHPDAWSWPLPVNGVEGLTFDDILRNVLVESPKVVGFSSYVWNYKLNLELGKAIKELLPDCILVYGGPEVPYDQHPNWLKENYFVDLIADSKGTGEEFMMTLLDQLAEGSFNPAEIPYCITPSADRTTATKSVPTTKRTDLKWPRSMFYGNETEVQLLKHIAQSKDARLTTLWETTRGCPHACAYCDWGGSTGVKVLKKSEETVYEELKYMESLNIEYIDVCDANFGIFKERDVNIIQYIIDRAKLGWDVEIGLNGKTKNDITTVQKIDFMTLESKIAVKSDYHYSVNASDSVVSKAVNRWSYPTQIHIDFVKKVKSLGYKTRIEYILGLPETTLDIFYNEYNDIAYADAWLSERYVWSLLAKSPAAKPAYREKYRIETVPVRYTHYNTLRQLTKSEYYLLDDPKYQGYFDLVIATSTYTKQEWLQMYFMDNFVRGVECLSVTTSLREHCETLGVSAGQFFRYCWATLEKMRASGNEGLAEIFSSIEDALQGKITFAYYQYQGQILGLQTISSFFLTKYADEFVSIFREFLPQDAEVDHQIGKMKSRLETLKNNADPVRRIVDEHSSYVYGSLSKKINSTSALKAVGNGIE
ncbi:MAG: hypothetical protein JNM24_15520 [Bdellovibrionaceae bacterium]|nr:hypothetical protein [Pseudobdellovibrionaceae bacterium]